MKLLEKPLSSFEKHVVLDFLDGNRNRICVADDPKEIFTQLGFAIDRLFVLAQSRFLELIEKTIKESDNQIKQLKGDNKNV